MVLSNLSLSKYKSPGDPPSPRKGTRITPRTCLWPLAGSLVVTFALSIGLTFGSDHHCYAGTCGEWLFPLQARLHVIIWYFWISITVTVLALRAFHPEMQKVLARPLAERKLPLIGKQLTPSGALMFLWVISLYGIVVGVWWIRLRDYFVGRSIAGGIAEGGNRLAAIALTGHLADITMGMVMLPISRHSALASFFKLSVATTLTNHMFAAYTLFTLVLSHGFLYVSWVPVHNSLSVQLRTVIPVLNPTYLYHETWPGNTTSLGIWRASLIFTGLAAVVIMFAIFITTLPMIRRKHFNLFYFTHIFSIVMIIIICLHASTMFYCTAPGLAMWFLDWGMRLHELRRTLDGEISTIGNGWYCVTMPLPRARLSGCSCRSPLAHFYIHHSGSSIRELHPFTTITHLASRNSTTPASEDDFPIQFLFRKRGKPIADQSVTETRLNRYLAIPRLLRTKKQRIQSTQWTDRLASLVDEQQGPMRGAQATTMDLTPMTTSTATSAPPIVYPFPRIDVSLRLEGPYFTPADPSRYNTVVCLVAGTGISGAIAIAAAFTEAQRSRTENDCCPPSTCGPSTAPSIHRWRKCIVIWSVKAADAITIPFFDIDRTPGLEVQTHVTGEGRKRVDVGDALAEMRKRDPEGKMWVYISGPNAFIEVGSRACKAQAGVDWYAASWDI